MPGHDDARASDGPEAPEEVTPSDAVTPPDDTTPADDAAASEETTPDTAVKPADSESAVDDSSGPAVTTAVEAEADDSESGDAEAVITEPADAEAVDADEPVVPDKRTSLTDVAPQATAKAGAPPAAATNAAATRTAAKVIVPSGDSATDPAPKNAADPASTAPATPGSPEPAADAPLADPDDAARARLFRALRPRASRGQLLAAVICAVLGFAVVVQVRQAQGEGLSALRQSDLITVLDNVTQQSARLDDQAAALQKTLDDLQSASDRSPAARAAAQERLEVLGVLAGTQGAAGPGIELDITDPKGQVNATDILGAVEELRDAGAEAIQIGPARVVASTAFVDDPHGVFVDHTLVTAPFRMLVIGDPQTLGAALEIPGGVLESLRSKGADGAVHPEQTLQITALRQVSAPQYARPASPAAP